MDTGVHLSMPYPSKPTSHIIWTRGPPVHAPPIKANLSHYMDTGSTCPCPTHQSQPLTLYGHGGHLSMPYPSKPTSHIIWTRGPPVHALPIKANLSHYMDTGVHLSMPYPSKPASHIIWTQGPPVHALPIKANLSHYMDMGSTCPCPTHQSQPLTLYGHGSTCPCPTHQSQPLTLYGHGVHLSMPYLSM